MRLSFATLVSSRRIVTTLLIAAAALFSVSCEEEADNKLALAQECLDGLKDSDPSLVTKADACERKVDGLSSAESYVIRCSVQFIKGGITASTIVAAFDDYDDAPANEKAAVLIANLSQSSPSQATNTQVACERSGVPSLIYIAAMSLTGTLVLDAGSGDPAQIIADLNACETSPGSCDDTAIGTAVTTMYGAYCVGDAADTEACQDVGAAIASGGGDPAAVALALYNLLQ